MKKFGGYFLAIVLLFAIWQIGAKNKIETTGYISKIQNKIQAVSKMDLPCDKPFEYSIGTIDSRFNIDENAFLQIIDEAQKVWDKQAGKELFTYNPQASFKINLIFDERQTQSDEEDKLNANLDQLKTTQNTISNQYGSLSATYKKILTKYNTDVVEYEKQVNDYNQAVTDWNTSDKTLQRDFDSLQKTKKNLAVFYQTLQKEQVAVNALVKKTNNLVSQEKKAVKEYNSQVSTYKEKYGASQEFEKGVYQGTQINIYQFKQASDLKMTLIHELGHALGLGHVENSKSIMYYLMGDQDMQNPTFSAEDIAELEKVCRLK